MIFFSKLGGQWCEGVEAVWGVHVLYRKLAQGGGANAALT